MSNNEAESLIARNNYVLDWTVTTEINKYCEKYKSLAILFYVFNNKSKNIFMLMPFKKTTVFEKISSTYKKSQTSNITQN